MEDTNNSTQDAQTDLKAVVRGAIEEFLKLDRAKSEPAYKQELLEERRKREQLESRLNDLAEENRRTRVVAEEMERSSTIRTELQKLGVTKLDLAFKAVKDDIVRNEEGKLIARTESGDFSAKDYLAKFLNENPELLPGRIQGGSGAGPGHKAAEGFGSFDLDKIRPGMNAEDLERARQEIARIAGSATRGL